MRLIEQLPFTLGVKCEPVGKSAEIFFRGLGPACVRSDSSLNLVAYVFLIGGDILDHL